jgi:hypothetical protein
MAEWVKEVHEGSATVGKDGNVTAVRTFRYNSGNAASRPAWSIAGIGINRYDAHPDDDRLLATDVSAVPVSGELGWFTVSYTYSNRVFEAGTTDPSGDPGASTPTTNPNPTARPATAKWSTNTRMVPFTIDYDDPRKVVANSAGQVYEGQEREVVTTLLTISFNMPGSVDISTKQQGYCGKLNDDFFAPIPIQGPYEPGGLRCNSWEGSYQYEAGYGWYTSCEVTFEWNPDGWQRDLIDQGYYRRVSTGPGMYGTEKIISPTTGQAPDAPTKLNGNGEVLNPGDNPVVPAGYFVVGGGTPDVSVYRRFYPYEWVSFTSIFT